jgi:hypothetical protein
MKYEFEKPAACPDCLPLAMAYVPMQKWQKIYDPDLAICRGTLFEQLDLPFLGEQAIRE